MNKFNQKEYINEYNKQHYSIFKVSLKKEEKKELNKLLKQNNLTNADFLRNAIKDLKGEINNEKISYEELGKKLGKYFSKKFDRYYSENIIDWEDDILRSENNANVEYDEENKEETYYIKVEVSENQKIEYFEFVEKIKYNDNDEIINQEYYIY